MLGRSLNRSLDLCARRATGAKGFSLSPGRALKVGPSVIILIQGGERHEGRRSSRHYLFIYATFNYAAANRKSDCAQRTESAFPCKYTLLFLIFFCFYFVLFRRSLLRALADSPSEGPGGTEYRGESTSRGPRQEAGRLLGQ